MHRNARIGLVGLALLLAGCRGHADAGSPSSATVPEPPLTTDPEITVGYLNQVFAELDQIDGDALRLIVRDRAVKPEALDLLKTIYAPDEFEAQVDLIADALQEGFTNARPTPGDRKTSVTRIIHAGANCVFVEVERDYDALRIEPMHRVRSYVALQRSSRSRPAWVFLLEGARASGEPPESPCGA